MRLAGPRLRALHAENSRTAQSIPEFREVGVQTRPIYRQGSFRHCATRRTPTDGANAGYKAENLLRQASSRKGPASVSDG